MKTGRIMGHTRTSVLAVQNIKNQIKREVITLEDIIGKPSKDLLEKKEYMQSKEFLNDIHNTKMMDLGDRLYELRNADVSEEKELLNEISKSSRGTVLDKII